MTTHSKVDQIILIGNYKPDKQKSMEKFLEMLLEGLKHYHIKVEAIYPSVFFGNYISPTHSILGKYLSYFDKWILFPIVLKSKLMHRKYKSENLRFHICDHSNAMYIDYLPKDRTIITCHDVLAIRGSFGFKDAYCEASATGIILQKWILRSLNKFKKIAFVSQTTKNQMLELIEKPGNHFESGWPVIFNALNARFYKMSDAEIAFQLEKYPELKKGPFILHVGSALPRKNRSMLLKMLHIAGDQWNGNICFAGETLDDELIKLVNELQLSERVFSHTNVNADSLLLFYNAAFAFVFPSFSEGFGWPVIEAQACGTPVITSNINPMPEIAGKGAILADPNAPMDFTKAFLSLQKSSEREDLVNLGFQNVKRFDREGMLNLYINLYNL